MPECEVCGAEVNRLYKVEIDGVVLNVCRECSKLGKRLEQPRKRRRRKIIVDLGKEIDEEKLDPDYANKIVKARELLKYTREELARKLGVKLSFWERIEKGDAKPTVQIAKRIERVLGVQVMIKKEKTSEEQLKQAAEKLREKIKKKKKKKPKRKIKDDIPDETFDGSEVKSEPEPQLTIGDIAQIIVKKKK